MSDRKSQSRRAQSDGLAGRDAGAIGHTRALSGDSETVLSSEELERIVAAVWEHGRVMPDADSAMWRQDACGAWMMREHFGRADSDFGWKIEKVGVDGGGGTGRLRPYNWRNHFDIANGRPRCGMSADRTDVPAEKLAEPPRNKPR